MKRRGDAKTFVPSISVIFTLLVSTMISGCAVTGGALITAAYEGQTTAVKDLLNKGANVNERGGCGLWDKGGDFGATPLFCAAHSGHMEVVKELIDRGADVNARTNDHGFFGRTPLTAAAFARHADIAKLLIDKGADVDYAMENLKKSRLKDQYDFLERIVKEQRQAPKYQATSSTLSTTLPLALPLTTEPAAPF